MPTLTVCFLHEPFNNSFAVKAIMHVAAYKRTSFFQQMDTIVSVRKLTPHANVLPVTIGEGKLASMRDRQQVRSMACFLQCKILKFLLCLWPGWSGLFGGD